MRRVIQIGSHKSLQYLPYETGVYLDCPVHAVLEIRDTAPLPPWLILVALMSAVGSRPAEQSAAEKKNDHTNPHTMHVVEKGTTEAREEKEKQDQRHRVPAIFHKTGL